MNLQQLRYFCLIAECGGVTHAAERAHVAQPAMSKMLAQLEQELGVQLFDRNGKRIELNSNGKRYYEQIRYALNLIDDAGEQFAPKPDNVSGKITICVDFLIPYLATFITRFHKEYPNINLQISIYEDNKPIRAVGDYNVAITNIPNPQRERKEFIIAKDEMAILLPEGHRLANEKEIHMDELRDENFVYCCRSNDSLQARYDALCHLANFEPNVFLVGADLDVTTTTVRNNQGISILPGSAIFCLSDEQMAGNRLVNIASPNFAMPIYAVTPVGKSVSDAAKSFLKFTEDYFGRMFPDGVCGLNHPYVEA